MRNSPLLLLLAFCPTAFAQDQQLGARAKGMGGSYTAFEDDPVSIWLNPAGIAAQPDQLALVYQTYTAYPVDRRRGPSNTVVTSAEPETVLADPAALPSYLGAVFQFGSAAHPFAVGVAIARPYHIHYAPDRVLDPNTAQFEPEDSVEQSFYRLRVAAAYSLRLREVGRPALSDDGQWIVFESAATNLTDRDSNGASDIFLHGPIP